MLQLIRGLLSGGKTAYKWFADSSMGRFVMEAAISYGIFSYFQSGKGLSGAGGSKDNLILPFVKNALMSHIRTEGALTLSRIISRLKDGKYGDILGPALAQLGAILVSSSNMVSVANSSDDYEETVKTLGKLQGLTVADLEANPVLGEAFYGMAHKFHGLQKTYNIPMDAKIDSVYEALQIFAQALTLQPSWSATVLNSASDASLPLSPGDAFGNLLRVAERNNTRPDVMEWFDEQISYIERDSRMDLNQKAGMVTKVLDMVVIQCTN